MAGTTIGQLLQSHSPLPSHLLQVIFSVLLIFPKFFKLWEEKNKEAQDIRLLQALIRKLEAEAGGKTNTREASSHSSTIRALITRIRILRAEADA